MWGSIRQIGSEGIEGFFAHQYDQLARSPISMARYREFAVEVTRRLKAGEILEIGPGPGFIAIEIARLLPEVKVTGLDVSHTMVEIATRNVEDAGVANRVTFRLSNAAEMPFSAESFDLVVSSGSLHEWKRPIPIFKEVHRVLKQGGSALIGDLRRDAPQAMKDELARKIDSRLMRWGLRHSFGEAYTRQEILALLGQTHFDDYQVAEDGCGLTITLKKHARKSSIQKCV